MKRLIEFKNNDSGAVTVDWVVLTAAIVGIAMAVIILISGGLENASSDIDDSLRSAGTGWSFLTGGTQTLEQFVSDYIDAGDSAADLGAMDEAVNSIIADLAPDGYNYTGQIDNETGTAVYVNDFDPNTGFATSYSINGEIIDANDYDLGNASTDQSTIINPV